ncbi:RNA ligase/cyclic nucleotide phosphodiesterase [Aspergillus floccosus]
MRRYVNPQPFQVQLQARYEAHRVTRNSQQTAKILADDFAGWNLDEILMRLDGPAKEEGYVDPRNCLVIWAKPPPQIRELIAFVQRELKEVAPTLWLMPSENLHTTVLEIAHSLTEAQIEDMVKTLRSSNDISTSHIADYTFSHRTRLVKPMVSFDSAAMALSFVPAAGEGSEGGNPEGDSYSYHHLRRDVFEMVRKAGIPVASRYSVPSAHLTIGRFITQDGFTTTGADGQAQVDHTRVKTLIEKIEDINKKLQSGYWPRGDGTIPAGGEWHVGEEKGLVVQKGRLWYGDGTTVQLGKGY